MRLSCPPLLPRPAGRELANAVFRPLISMGIRPEACPCRALHVGHAGVDRSPLPALAFDSIRFALSGSARSASWRDRRVFRAARIKA